MLAADRTAAPKAFTKATLKMLEPIKLGENDKLRVTVDEKLEHFIVHAYSTKTETVLTPVDRVIRVDLPFITYEKVEHQVIEERKVVHTYSYCGDAWTARIPQRRQVYGGDKRFNHWELAATDYTVQVLAALWPRDKLDFDDDARQLFDYIALTVEMQERTTESYARYRDRHDWLKAMREHSPEFAELAEASAPAIPGVGRLEVHPERPLAPYQYVGLWNMMQSEGYGLLMEQGTGKTPTAIAEICNLCKVPEHDQHAGGRPMRVLVACPKNVRQNWLSEFHKFATQTGEVTVLRGGAIQRVTALTETFTNATLDKDCRYVVVIASYETIERSWAQLKHIDWDVCYVDEAHNIRNTYTKRFKRFMELRENCARRRVLTGTPLCNSPLDSYALFEFMHKGGSGFSTHHAFKQFYGVFERGGNGGQMIALQNLPFMQERFARMSFQVRKAEAMPDMPSKVYDVVEVEMTAKQADVYEQLSKKLAAEIEDEFNSDRNRSMVVNNVLTKLLRLAQVTSGFVAWDGDVDAETGMVLSRNIEQFDPNPKLDMLVEELKAMPQDEKTIVWACFVPDIRAIKARLEKEGIRAVFFYGGTSDKDRAEAERAFNYDRDCRVFVGNPAAGGTGLNLIGYPPGDGEAYETDVTREIYYSQNWSAVTRSQSEDRGHRRGTRRQVRITDLCVPGTIDEQIRTRVMDKIITALQISDVRAILKAVLHGVERDDD